MMAGSVIPTAGQFIINQKKNTKGTKNLAQSVGFGLFEEGSIQALNSLN